jgi:hypothetical protein
MRYDPNYRSMGHYLRTSRELGAALAAAAEVGAAAVRAVAPVGDPSDPWYKHTGRSPGEYLASIHTTDGPVVKPGNTAPRQSKRVVADAPHSIFVELRDHPLQAAIDAIEGPGG